ncbi:hypothetical protein PybrP1_006452 [[Pythium] brassicae (nom. inval.)]|nr:hypothetical protein PybrP1_006452 [[Pythium] brassicae (nom. inval.)]
MVKANLTAVILLALAATSTNGQKAVCNDGAATPTTAPTPGPKHRPTIVGHRGAPGYLPEHTIESYTLAIEMGVDFIEPDLVSTKDGVLVARHEPNIVATTDVADRPEFASRQRTMLVDGRNESGFFVSDFTLAEIKTIRAKQAMSDRDQSYNGKYQIPTLAEVITLAKAKSKDVGRTIGIYPETKHSIYHRDLGLPLEEKLLEALKSAGWNTADAPVIIQSFEQANLKELRKQTPVKLAQLVDSFGAPYDWTVSGRNGTVLDLLSKSGLDEVKTYADIIAPYKRHLVQTRPVKTDPATGATVDVDGDKMLTDADYYTSVNSTIIADAHARGLLVHSWTFRDEYYRLAANYSSDPTLEYIDFFHQGLDGLFSDNAKTAVAARATYLGN